MTKRHHQCLERGGHYRKNWTETVEDSVVRSPDGGRPRRKQKPRSRDNSQDGATLANINLPIMSKDAINISSIRLTVNSIFWENCKSPSRLAVSRISQKKPYTTYFSTPTG